MCEGLQPAVPDTFVDRNLIAPSFKPRLVAQYLGKIRCEFSSERRTVPVRFGGCSVPQPRFL
jgi:hypothetical protein